MLVRGTHTRAFAAPPTTAAAAAATDDDDDNDDKEREEGKKEGEGEEREEEEEEEEALPARFCSYSVRFWWITKLHRSFIELYRDLAVLYKKEAEEDEEE